MAGIKPEFVKVIYLATPAINYRRYGVYQRVASVDLVDHVECGVVLFQNVVLYRNINDFICLSNVCICIYDIQ